MTEHYSSRRFNVSEQAEQRELTVDDLAYLFGAFIRQQGEVFVDFDSLVGINDYGIELEPQETGLVLRVVKITETED